MNTTLTADQTSRLGSFSQAEALPADLRQWQDETALVGLVLEAVAALESESPGRLGTFRNPEGIGALPLLSLITYAYATGRRSSDEIEEAARHDRALAYLAAGQLPSSPTIRRFRRAFNPVITRVLFQVLRRVANRRPEACDRDSAGVDGSLFQEARRRVNAAVLADTMALDY